MTAQTMYHKCGVDISEPSLSVTNEQIHSLTYRHSILYRPISADYLQ